MAKWDLHTNPRDWRFQVDKAIGLSVSFRVLIVQHDCEGNRSTRHWDWDILPSAVFHNEWACELRIFVSSGLGNLCTIFACWQPSESILIGSAANRQR